MMGDSRMVEFVHGRGKYWLAVPAESDGSSEVAAFKAGLDRVSVLARRDTKRGPGIRGVQRFPVGSGRLSGKAREAAMSRVLGHSMIVSAMSVIPVNDDCEGEAIMSGSVDSMKASEVASVLGFAGTPRVYQLIKSGELVKAESGGVTVASVEAFQAAKAGKAGGELGAEMRKRGRPVGSKNAKPAGMAVRVGSKVSRARASSFGRRWADASLSELVVELEAVKLEILRKIGAS